jgi:hypothetical protein
LQAELAAGKAKLTFDKDVGYLPALLEALDVPVDSQTLVFSKTSMQRQHISPRHPRALYFNDDVYIGYCQSGEVMEVLTADPQLGAVFYTLAQNEDQPPKLLRQTDNCLTCHSSSRTEGVPGLVLRSVTVGSTGEPVLSEGSVTVDYRTPLEKRWGGWYVTGTHGSQKHMGNLVRRGSKPAIEDQSGLNLVSLDKKFDKEKYPSPHSDIVALMVLEEQSVVHNRLTRANFETRSALYYQTEMNKALKQPEDEPLDSVTRRIHAAGDELVEALLMVDEAELTGAVKGTSTFTETFPAHGPKDRQGRSLRDFDLKRRTFKYPCSYLIYTAAFDDLPDAMRDYVWQRLGEVLRGDDASGKFDHLSADDRQAIAEILRDTKKGLPANWPY